MTTIDRESKLAAHALRNRRHRARAKKGVAMLPVAVTVEIVNWLVKQEWLDPREAYDPPEIADAIGELLETSAKSG